MKEINNGLSRSDIDIEASYLYGKLCVNKYRDVNKSLITLIDLINAIDNKEDLIKEHIVVNKIFLNIQSPIYIKEKSEILFQINVAFMNKMGELISEKANKMEEEISNMRKLVSSLCKSDKEI